MGKAVGVVVEEDRNLMGLVRLLVPGPLEVEQDKLGRLGDIPVVRLESHSRTRTNPLMILMSWKVKVMAYDLLLAVLVDAPLVVDIGCSGIKVET